MRCILWKKKKKKDGIFLPCPHLEPGLNPPRSRGRAVWIFQRREKWGHDALNCKCVSHSWSIFNTPWFHLIARQYCWGVHKPVSSTETLVFRSAGTSPVRPPFNDPQARRESRLFQYRVRIICFDCSHCELSPLKGSAARRPSRSLRFCRGPAWILSYRYFAVITSVIQLRRRIPEPGRDGRGGQWLTGGDIALQREREDKGRHEYLSRSHKRIL